MINMKLSKRILAVVLVISVLFTSLGLDELSKSVQAVATYTTIYFKDETSKHWIGDKKAVMELVDNTTGHDSYIMKKVNSTTWSAKVPATVFNVTFNRLSPYDGKQWNSWSAGGRGKSKKKKDTWSSTYHATVPEHGYWDGIPEDVEGFHEGDVIYLDYYEYQEWGRIYPIYYVNFTDADNSENQKYEAINIKKANKEKYKPIMLNNEIEDMVYTYTVTAEDEGATELRFWRGNSSELWNASVVLHYSDYQEGNNCVKVQDMNDTGYVCPYVPRRHVPVVENKTLEVLGNKKVNRKIQLNLDLRCEEEYVNLEDTKFTVKKLNSEGAVASELDESDYLIYDEDASTWNHRELLFKKSGSYKVTTKTYSNDKIDCYETEEIISIVDDNAPVAVMDVSAENAENETAEENVFVRNKNGISGLKITDQSVSEINDEINSRNYSIYYDKNKDGKFSEDEIVENVSGNETTFSKQLKRVGKYQIVETVKETFTDTIPKLLKDEDYLTGTTTREFEIVNKAPVSSMNVKKSKIADIVFTVGYAESEQYDKYMELVGGVKKKFEESGIEANVSTLKSSLLTAQDNFAWKEYDHINFEDRRVQCRLPKHIEYSDKDITMRGYSEVAYKDFLYVPDTNSDKKLFEFDLERDNDKTEERLWHSIEGAGFLFNTEVSDEENYIQGYCVLLCSGYLSVYQINRSDLTSFRNGWNSRKLLVQKEVADASQKHHWRIIVEKNIVTVLDGETVVIDQFAVPDDGIEAYGYGPITSHRSHDCEQQSYFTFHDIKMKTFSGESLRDLEGHKWTPGDNHYVINFNEDSVTELCNNDAIGDIAATLISNNASFYGIGKEKSIEQFNALINAIDGKGENISLSDVSDDSNQSVTLEMAFEHVVERMIADVNSKNYEIGDMISSDEKVEYTGTYTDFDGDAKGEEQWIYEYNPSVFDTDKKENQILTLKNPIEIFENTGAYAISHKVSDDLGEENVYSLWSNEDDYKKLILSQQRPIADINVVSILYYNKFCNVDIKYSAKDNDHLNDSNKGIKKEEFYYKQISDENWTEGKLPLILEIGTTYLVKYVVTDIEGTQSRPKVVSIKTNSVKKYQSVEDKNPPEVTLATDRDIVEVGEKYYIETYADDNVGIRDFYVQLDKKKIATTYGRIECDASAVGEHVITAVATDWSGNKTTETKIIKVVDKSDVVPPTIEIASPANGKISGDTDVVGSIKDDKNLKKYTISRTKIITDTENEEEETSIIAEGTEEIINDTLATIKIDGVAAGIYRYTIDAEDCAGNTATFSFVITVTEDLRDRISPEANIDAITLNEESELVTVYGTVSDNDEISGYKLYLRKDDNLMNEQIIGFGSNSVTQAILGSVSVSELTNGEYILRLVAEDKTGNTCECTSGFTYETKENTEDDTPAIEVEPDLTSPVVVVDVKSVVENGKLKIKVTGTIADDNLDNYSIVTGPLDENGELTEEHQICTGNASVNNGNIAEYVFDTYQEGKYGVNIVGTDKSGNTRTVKYVVTVNDKKLVEENYDGEEEKNENPDENLNDVPKESLLNLVLSRTIADLGTEVNAYFTYPKSAKNVKITADGADVELSDRVAKIKAKKAGEVTVVLSATIDGKITTMEKTVRFFDRSDRVHPVVQFIAPEADSEISEVTDIFANIYDETSLAYYIVDYTSGTGNGEYIELARGTKPVKNEKVAELDTTKLQNGSYTIRITAVDNGGNLISIVRNVTVNGKVKIGNMAIEFTDINANVAGLPLMVTRKYDSNNKFCGDFGYGWTMGIGSAKVTQTNSLTSGYELVQTGERLTTAYELKETVPHDVVVTYGDGTCDRFKLVLSPSRSIWVPITEVRIQFQCVTDKRVKLELAGDKRAYYTGNQLVFGDWSNTNNSFILTRADGTKLFLSEYYGLTKMQDANDNAISITKSGYKHSCGNSLIFTRDENGRITKAEHKNAKGNLISSISYTYDEKGNLETVKDNLTFIDKDKTINKTVTFVYDDDHNLLDIIDPSGIAVARNEYDENGRLISTTDAKGKKVTYTHDLNENKEIIKDKNGNITTYVYDKNGNIKKIIDALGNVVENTYDSNNNLTERKDANGNITKYEYDDNMFLSKMITPDKHEATVSYNQYNLVSGIDFENEHLVDLQYDTKGNLVGATDAEGNETSLEYDQNGKLTGIADKIGTVYSLEYNANHQISKMIDGKGNATEFTYNVAGQCGGVSVYRTNASGKQIKYTSSYTYDTAGNVISSRDNNGKTTYYVYDPITNNKISEKAPDGKITKYIYDEVNNLIEIDYPDNTKEAFEYDFNGNVTKAVSRTGSIISMKYDELNRLITKNYCYVEDDVEKIYMTEKYVYDANGNLISYTSPSKGVTEYTYDCMNRNTSIKDPYNHITTFEYNNRSLLTKRKDALGNEYQYEYDKNGNQTKMIYPDGAEETITYDERGRVVVRTDRNGNETHYTYDKADNLIEVKDAMDGVYSYTYDETYELTAVTDANGNKTSYDYYGDGALYKITNAAQKTATYSYSSGRISSYKDFSGKSRSYTYDNYGRIKSTYVKKNNTTYYEYDEVGRIKNVKDKNGNISYTYDLLGRLASKKIYSYGEIKYTYDNANRIHSITNVVNNKEVGTTTYEYDKMDRITKVVGHDGSATLYEYDEVGNRTKVRHEGGVTVSYQYDVCQRLINEIVTDTDGSILMYYGYDYGKAGEKTKTVEVVRENADADARVIYTEYAYDKLLRLTGEKIQINDKVDFATLDTTPLFDTQNKPQMLSVEDIAWSGTLENQYTYDAVSNRTGKKTEVTGDVCGLDQDIQVGETTYTYNELNQMVDATYKSPEGSETTTEYAYDDNGNLVSEHGGKTDKTYTYNESNKLITATVTNGNDVTIESYTYDYEGNRVTKQINEDNKVFYLNDTFDELTQVSLELSKEADGSFSVNKYYTRGLELISVDISDDAKKEYTKKTYIQDGHGSVTALLENKDNKNSITDTYCYDAYGNLLQKTGDTENDYLYTGEQYNANTGLYYLRARYMNPETGTFISMDSYAGTLDNPVSLHKYLYANANPVMYTDPTGYFSLLDSEIAAKMRTTLSNAYDYYASFSKMKKLMSAINLAVTIHDVSEQYNLLMAGEATVTDLAIAMAKGLIVQTLITCTATALFGKLAASILKVVGIAQDTIGFVDAVKTGDPEEIIVAALRLTVSVFTLKCQCFTGDTLVSTEDGDRRIDEIQAGDYVWAYNTETGERELKKVLSTPVTETDILVHVGLSDGTEIQTTMLHPFYVKTEDGGEWVAASNLTKGDEVLTEDGRVVYVENVQVEKLDKKIKVYNLEIEDLHTYFVAGGVLVHNRCKLGENMKQVSADPGANYDAHHIFPQKYRPYFEMMGIEIDEADFGIWLEKHIHRRNSYSYNNLWHKFFERYDFDPEKLRALDLQTACDYISEIGRKW